MTSPLSRCIENDVSPDQERLSPEDARAIRDACAGAFDTGVEQLLVACPPRSPRGPIRFARNSPTLYIGLLGQCFGFLHLYERSGNASQLRLADEYLTAATEAIARSSYAPPDEWLSFHGVGGVAAIAAVVKHHLGDSEACARHLADYRALAPAAADPDYPTEDLLWGRGGFLFGAAFLRARLGQDSIPDTAVEPALEAMVGAGRQHAHEHAGELTGGRSGITPLLYLNFGPSVIGWFTAAIIGSRRGPARWLARQAASVVSLWGAHQLDISHRFELSLVHGLPGNLYLLMHYPDLLAAHPDWQGDVRKALDCLTEYVDREQGVLELLPSPRSDASQKRRKLGRFTDRVHWCAGTPAMVFVFSRAFEVFGADRYRQAAMSAADHVWRNGLVRKGNGICHGLAGNGYAFLSLFHACGDDRAIDRALHFARLSLSPRIQAEQRRPDRPWSLYEGAMGTLCFYADCQDPARARFPGFEI